MGKSINLWFPVKIFSLKSIHWPIQQSWPWQINQGILPSLDEFSKKHHWKSMDFPIHWNPFSPWNRGEFPMGKPSEKNPGLLNLMMKSLYCLGLIQNSQGLVWTCSMLRGATKFFVICHFFAFQILFSTMLSKSGWWYTYPSEKIEFVSWDYSSQYGKIKAMFETTNQSLITINQHH